MGNIRPTYIKRIAVDLVQKYPTVFNDDFENNKMLVSKLTNCRIHYHEEPYRWLRNKVLAAYGNIDNTFFRIILVRQVFGPGVL